jgi:hypothetical protein
MNRNRIRQSNSTENPGFAHLCPGTVGCSGVFAIKVRWHIDAFMGSLLAHIARTGEERDIWPYEHSLHLMAIKVVDFRRILHASQGDVGTLD